MFEFHWPWVAVLLPLPLLLPYLWPRRPEQAPEEDTGGAAPDPAAPRLDALQAAYQTRRPRLPVGGWIHRALLSLLWIGLVVGPDAARSGSPPTPRSAPRATT